LPDWCVRLGLALAFTVAGAVAHLGTVTPPALAVGPVAVARQEESPRSHHEQGRRQFGQGQYEGAIASYRKAYELKADPSYLLDIAEAYRALDVPERAVFFYNRYLSAHPNPPNRFEVEAEVARLKLRLPEVAVAPVAPAAATSPSPGVPLSTRGQALPPGAAAGMGSDVGLAARPVRDDQRPLVGRWWFWTAIGALAATGATVAILSSSRGGDEPPRTQLGHAKLF
jgi:tetratricopeptide (TPR) repeat protein